MVRYDHVLVKNLTPINEGESIFDNLTSFHIYIIKKKNLKKNDIKIIFFYFKK